MSVLFNVVNHFEFSRMQFHPTLFRGTCKQKVIPGRLYYYQYDSERSNIRYNMKLTLTAPYILAPSLDKVGTGSISFDRPPFQDSCNSSHDTMFDAMNVISISIAIYEFICIDVAMVQNSPPTTITHVTIWTSDSCFGSFIRCCLGCTICCCHGNFYFLGR